MATRSLIGVLHEAGPFRGKIEYIYCHWDGYPSHNGAVLLDNYTNKSKVYELMSIGDISSLGPEIGVKHDFNDRNYKYCKSFSRDRGEKDTQSSMTDDEKKFKTLDHGTEYKYLFKNGKWYFSDGKFNFTELTQDVCAE